MQTQADRDAIADEAVGQRRGVAPEAVKGKPDLSPEEIARLGISAGAQASIPEKTAEALGERVPDAYSNPDLANGPVPIGGTSARGKSIPFELQQFAILVTGLALGYVAAVLFHARITAFFDQTPEPFRITRPPQGDRHPRGFVQSTVLKFIAEHPQGMTAAEIIEELSREGIGRQSIEYALGALVQAKKVSEQGSGGKFIPATDEVPTAPDQPSS